MRGNILGNIPDFNRLDNESGSKILEDQQIECVKTGKYGREMVSVLNREKEE